MRFDRVVVAVLAMIMALGVPTAGSPRAIAQDASPAAGPACGSEAEPNDIPDALPTIGGPVCVEGTLPSGDQDLTLWELRAEAAATPWIVTVEGVPGTLTGLKLLTIASEPGVTPIIAGNQVLEVAVQPDATGPARVGPVLLPAGMLILGISRSDTTGGPPPTLAYRYRLEQAEPLATVTESEPNDDAATATPIVAATTIGGDASGSTDRFVWTVDGTPADRAWRVDLVGPVTSGLMLTLQGPDGTDRTTGYQDALGAIVLPDLQLEPGSWSLVVYGAGDRPTPYAITTSLTPATADAEPNDATDRALPMDLAGGATRGRLYPGGDRDRYLVTIPASDPPMLRDLKLLGGERLRRSLCLGTPDGRDLQCDEDEGGVALRSLVLAPGSYLVTVGGDPDEAHPYVLRFDTTAEPVPDFEREPNDEPMMATPFDPSIVMRGLGGPTDTDLFRLDVTGDAQLWELRVAGREVDRLSWIRPDGSTYADGAVDPDRSRATLTDLYLVPGQHWFRVGATGDYTVSAVPLGPPDPDAEREPNNASNFAQPYRLGRDHLVGRLTSISDQDVLRFTLAGTERVTLVVDPPPDGIVGLELVEPGGGSVAEAHPAETGQAARLELLLEAGDHEVWLQPDVPSQGRYRFHLERGDPFPTRADEEPNGFPQTGQPVPPSLQVSGDMPPGDDIDWYRLPPLDPATPVTIEMSESVRGVQVSDGVTDLPLVFDSTALVATTDGLSGLRPAYLAVRALGPYTVTVAADGLAPAPDPVPPPVTMALVAETDSVGAYWAAGQRLRAELAVENTGPGPLDLVLDTVTSHAGWRATPSETVLVLGPSERRSVAIDVTIAPDAWADEPVRITARARDAMGGAATASTTVTPRGDVDPLRPEQAWSVPDALLGGIDVAALSLGARTIPAYDQRQEDELHDGFAHTGMGLARATEELPITLTVDLAGDAPVPVAGFALDPQGMDALSGEVPLDVELLLSADGASWQVAVAGRMTTLMGDQWFVLPEPIPATHAQLRILTTHGGGFRRAVLGEWKVIAVPGVSPVPHIDLAQPAAGGHMAWMDPQAYDEGTGPAWLDEAPSFASLWVKPATTMTWAVGFRDARAAQLTSLEWVDPIPSTAGQRFKEVTVERSLDGPAGPWTPVGTWTLERAADGSVSPFAFPEPTWVRYLRFSATSARKHDGLWDPPSTIRAIERGTDDGYRSVVGEWGAGAPEGPLEWLEPPDLSTPPVAVDADDTPETAQPIGSGSALIAKMDRPDDVDWSVFSVPEGHNTVDVLVTGRPIVAVALTLFDAEGLEVPMLFRPGDTPGTVRYSAEVDPGATYRLRVTQPPASIVFSFDTSGSMGLYLDYVFQALRAFTADVTPGEEYVRIVPFEEQALLDDWSDDPWTLQDAVGRYVGMGGSSSAESALIEATTALSAREGAKAVLIVTDAETSSFARQAELWRILGAVRPLVAAVHVGATIAPQVSSGYMQDWARVAGGFYQYTRSHGEMDRAFDRLATWLRRPAGYRLNLATAFHEKPPESRKPGTIEVTSPVGGTATLSPDVGVEIILDTSGSMLKQIKGQSRIGLAKRVLSDLVTRRLPAGMPVAVRVLGGARDVCGTDLIVPLGPLEPAAVVARVDGIDVAQETDTPLGQALRAVPADLEGSTGTRIVLLITDSEEVWPHPDLCGEDPAAAIRDLRRHGIDARLNIVGLQVDARKAAQQLRKWARLGNGSFFAARDAEQLGRSIRTAVSAPFRILDGAGNEVASGTVDGSAVPVPPGTYAVLVLTDPVTRFDAVEVGPGGSAALQLPEPTPPPSLEPVATPAT